MILKRFSGIGLCLILIGSMWNQPAVAGIPQWYSYYSSGLNAMERQDWNSAAKSFQEAIRLKDKETSKTRAYGAVFIEYFPHRELGICYYNLGDMANAERELSYSLSKSVSQRAKEYLDLSRRGNPNPASSDMSAPATHPSPNEPSSTPPSPVKKNDSVISTTVGERLSIAVLPFESKEVGGQLGGIDLLDKLITAFVNCKRFKVIERAQLEKILEEQKLGMSGVVDASTAAEIGKGIGVDGVIVGSVTLSRNALSIDARLIDTETAAIISAKDSYSGQYGLQSITQMVNELAQKFSADLPVITGVVINVTGDKVTLDMGSTQGIKKGMKCWVYREGEPIVHPVTGEVIGKMIDQRCELQISDVYDAYSTGNIILVKGGDPKVLDKVITK